MSIRSIQVGARRCRNILMLYVITMRFSSRTGSRVVSTAKVLVLKRCNEQRIIFLRQTGSLSRSFTRSLLFLRSSNRIMTPYAPAVYIICIVIRTPNVEQRFSVGPRSRHARLGELTKFFNPFKLN